MKSLKSLTMIMVIMLSTVMFVSHVYAEDDALCVYGSESYNQAIEIHLNEDAAPQVVSKLPEGIRLSSNNLFNVNFQDTQNNKWQCPEYLYYHVRTSSDSRSITWDNLSATDDSDGTFYGNASKLTVNLAQSKYGKAISSAADNIYYCTYGSFRFAINNTQKTVTTDSANTTLHFSYADINGNCPQELYRVQNHYYKEAPAREQYYTLKQDGTETFVDATGGTVAANTTKAQSTTGNHCPLGPDVTKDLSGALRIIKYVAPLLVFVLSAYEAIKTIMQNNAEDGMKKVAIRFGKRLVYVVILFFLPVIVDQVMQLMDVWDANGACKLDTPVPATEEECTSLGGTWNATDDSCTM